MKTVVLAFLGGMAYTMLISLRPGRPLWWDAGAMVLCAAIFTVISGMQLPAWFRRL